MQQRTVGFDLARSLAILGMIIVNFKVATGAVAEPAWLAWWTGRLEGRAAALFVLLAGVGISLSARDAGDGSRLRTKILGRALFLFVIGLLYAPLWPADILHFYGLYLVVGAAWLHASGRTLATVAIAFVILFPVLFLLFDYEAGWDWVTLDYSGFWTPAGMVRHLLFNGFHPVVPWTAFLLVGMGLGRLDLRPAPVGRRVLIAAITIAAVTETASALLVRAAAQLPELSTEEATFLFGTGPMPPLPAYVVAAGATAVAVVVVCVWVGERWGASLRPFVVTGQLALTLYVAHVVIGMGTLEATGHLENGSLPFAVGAAVLFYAAGVVFSVAWRRRFPRGPLEAVMRRGLNLRRRRDRG